MAKDANELGALEAGRMIAGRTLSSVELTEACLARANTRDAEIGAWQFLDPEHAIAQARAADEAFARHGAASPLHGVPIGIKDIIDTADMPTENGTPVDGGRQPRQDAACVAALRDAGAVILGKTVTTELAVFHPGKTRNPHNTGHTPGGSSSGSAAAVADHQVPISLGTQTAGSILRPASFCGVIGFKPTFGLISRFGCLEQCSTLDTIGPFSRTLEDIAAVTGILAAHDARDGDSYARARPPVLTQFLAPDERRVRLLVVRGPVWDKADPAAQGAFEAFISSVDAEVSERELGGAAMRTWEWQKTLQWSDIARNFGTYLDRSPELVSPKLTDMIQAGRRMLAIDYNIAREARAQVAAQLESMLGGYDAIVTLAAPGGAPRGLEWTGDPVFNSMATFAGLPAVSLPLLEDNGLPLGLQLIGARHGDGRLLNAAQRLLDITGR